MDPKPPGERQRTAEALSGQNYLILAPAEDAPGMPPQIPMVWRISKCRFGGRGRNCRETLINASAIGSFKGCVVRILSLRVVVTSAKEELCTSSSGSNRRYSSAV